MTAWERTIAQALEKAAGRLEDRAKFLRSAGLKEEANEADLCANTVRQMIKETV